MKTLSFFHPKSLSNQFFLLSFFFIALISFDAQSASINWVGANGNSGSRWHEASNWSPKTVPTSNDDVVIPNVKNAPVITTAAACNSITINTGASLTINAGGNLTVSGNWTNNGTFTQNSGTVTFVGDTSVDLGGEANTTFTSLKVNKGNGQSAEIRLNGKGKVEVSSSLSIDGGLLKINTGGNLNLSGTAKAPDTGVTVNGGVYTLKDGPITAMGVVLKSIKSGNWSDASTWDKTAVPTADDDVVISSGYTVSLTNKSYCNSIDIQGENGAGRSASLFVYGNELNVTNDIKNTSGKSSSIVVTSGIINVGGNFSMQSFTSGNGTVNYNGANQNIGAYFYHNLILSGTGTKTMQALTNVLGNVTIQEGVTLNEAGITMMLGSASILTVNGTLDFTDSDGLIRTGFGLNASLVMGSNGLIRTMDQSGIGPATGASLQNYGSGLWNTNSISNNGTIEYYRSTTSQQAITDRDYNNLIISGGNYSKTWTLALDRNINGNLAISTGASFNLSGTKNLNIKGNWTNNGTYTKGTETVTFNGAAQTISGATTFNHLTVAGTDTKTIASAASLTVEGNLTVNNNSTLKIESTGASATGSLIVKGSATVNGTVSAQRFLHTDNWHLISSPVSGQTLNNFASNNGIQLDGPTQTYDIGPYDEGNDRWSYTSQTSGFEAAKGYSTEKSLNGAGVATFTGNGIYTGSKSIGISRSTTGYGWNCIGNPYTSAILATGTGTNSLLGLNSGQLDPAYAALYFWNNSSGTYEMMTNSGTSYIAVGQGFMVKSKTGGGSISFASSMQSHQNGVDFKDAEIPWPTITLNAETSDSRSHTVVNFNEAMTTGLDPTYDGGMFKANPKLAIYTKLVGERLPVDFGVQSLPLNETDSYRIPVGVDVPSGGEISFSAEAVNLVGYKVVLEDALTSQLTPMGNEGEGYTTVVPANTTGAGRFYLRVSSSLTGTEPLAKPEFSVFLRDRNIIVNGDAGEQTVFTLCNIEGKQFSQQKATHRNQNIVNAQSLPAGVYLLRIDEPNRHQVAKVMIAQ